MKLVYRILEQAIRIGNTPGVDAHNLRYQVTEAEWEGLVQELLNNELRFVGPDLSPFLPVDEMTIGGLKVQRAISPPNKILVAVRAELQKARSNWPAFNSAHEGFAVLMKEVDELWDHVKTNQKKRDLPAMQKEAIQVAAMAMLFALEVCDEVNGRK